MSFELRLIHNKGTSSPAVARTAIQTDQLLQLFNIPQDKREAAKDAAYRLMADLIRCVEISDEFNLKVDEVDKSIDAGTFVFNPNAVAHEIPSIVNFRSKVESFLQGAKLAIRDTGNFMEPFYGISYGHNLSKLRNWVKTKFEENHNFVKFCSRWEPIVKRIILMRDAVDHEGDGLNQKLHCFDFSIDRTSAQPALLPPRWWLEGQTQTSLSGDMAGTIEAIVQMHEELVICLFYEFAVPSPFILVEIPIAERNPSCPVRYRIDIRQS